MPTPPSDDTRVLFSLIADGEWHEYYGIRDQIAKRVPPGRALRKYDDRIDRKRRQLNNPSYTTTATEFERQAYGAKECAQVVISSWKGRGLDQKREGETLFIRRTPGVRLYGIDNPLTPTEPSGADSEPSETADGGQDEPVAQQPEDTAPIADADLAEPEGPEPPPAVEDEGSNIVPEPVEEPPSSPPVTVGPEMLTCDQCGLYVFDEAKHEEFHNTHPVAESSREIGIFSESEVRHILEAVVSTQLDKFQQGMEAYLSRQFLQLESRMILHSGGSWRNGR